MELALYASIDIYWTGTPSTLFDEVKGASRPGNVEGVQLIQVPYEVAARAAMIFVSISIYLELSILFSY